MYLNLQNQMGFYSAIKPNDKEILSPPIRVYYLYYLAYLPFIKVVPGTSSYRRHPSEPRWSHSHHTSITHHTLCGRRGL